MNKVINEEGSKIFEASIMREDITTTRFQTPSWEKRVIIARECM